MELKLIPLLIGFLLVLGIQGKAISNEDNNASDEKRIDGNSKAFAPLSSLSHALEEEEEEEESEQPLTKRQLLENEARRFKRQAFTGEINEMNWIADTPTSVYLGWRGEGDLYDILIYSGYPVAGGPGLPLYRSVRGIKQDGDGGLYLLRNLQRNSDYLVHIKARKSDGREGEWMSFPRVTTG